ncbi:CBS domain-containing protein [Pseudonocardia hydrocarbonoxydans]|uniref:CBS domain-containing protein n=1 Tax=Pseudonocardia hydrocarbonoxydans TaxID=76726 RepID=A0A4Y3WPP6_9PSEU|nr:CBS domain-containing protein [Pseudonocardia hydrocarbonoxydans]GEC20040.1 hypothetical protein PHY01_23230 [Pseudonocardia hydrocarbonoxydans]
MSTPEDGGTVVVGVDGSVGSRAALEHALADAARRGARLRVVTAQAQPEFWATAYGPVPIPAGAAELHRMRVAARGWVDDVLAAHPREAAAVPIEVSAVPGPPADALIAASGDADLLVLGHRGRGALAGAVLGSVGMRCALGAACPVTVVRPRPAPARPRPSVRRSTVADVMTTDVATVSPDATFAQVADVLATRRVRAVPVCDDDGVLLGAVSEADLLVTAERTDPAPERRWWRPRPRHTGRSAPAGAAGATTAAGLMSAPAVAVGPGATVAHAARLMREHGLAWLPVVERDGRVVGVLGRSDLLSVFDRDDDGIRAEIVVDVLGRLLGVGADRVSVDVTDGVVTLDGELDTRADARLAVRSAERVEGVVAVADRLGFRVDERSADLSEVRRY